MKKNFRKIVVYALIILPALFVIAVLWVLWREKANSLLDRLRKEGL
jgi:hypothetical protein